MANRINIPELENMLTVKFNSQELYDLLLNISNAIEELNERIDILERGNK